MADGLPATVYRPGIVVGDSATGATQKYDGPYFLATFLRRQPAVALVPALGDADRVRVCLVPRDFVVGAMDELSVLDVSEGRTYALVDPDPPTVREVVTTFATTSGKRSCGCPSPSRPVHTLVDRVPGCRAAARAARRGARLLRLADDLRDRPHDARPRGIRPHLPALRGATRTGCSTSWSSTRSTTPTR